MKGPRDWSSSAIIPQNVIFCDDVRRELSGKDILIGAYANTIVIPSTPSSIAIALWIQVSLRKMGHIRVRLRITDPADAIAGETAFELNAHEIAETAIPMPPLLINIVRAGEITVYWAESQKEYVKIGAKQVVIGPVSTAYLQLSVPPPPVVRAP